MTRHEITRQIKRMERLLADYGEDLNEAGTMLVKRCIFARLREMG